MRCGLFPSLRAHFLVDLQHADGLPPRCDWSVGAPFSASHIFNTVLHRHPDRHQGRQAGLAGWQDPIRCGESRVSSVHSDDADHMLIRTANAGRTRRENTNPTAWDDLDKRELRLRRRWCLVPRLR